MKWSRTCLKRLVWLRRHRRVLIRIALVVAFFYVLGYFTPQVSSPGMCKIYG